MSLDFYDDWIVHHHILPLLVPAVLRRFPIQQAQRTGQKYVGDFDDEDDGDYNDDYSDNDGDTNLLVTL